MRITLVVLAVMAGAIPVRAELGPPAGRRELARSERNEKVRPKWIRSRWRRPIVRAAARTRRLFRRVTGIHKRRVRERARLRRGERIAEAGELGTLSFLGESVGKLATEAGRIFAPLTALGIIGLGSSSFHELTHARTPQNRVDALHKMAWAMQGVATLGSMIDSHPGFVAAGTVAGTSGGLLQSGVGTYRIVAGLRHGDRRRVILGALDLSAGTAWAASACGIGLPWTLGAFVGLTLTRMVYASGEGVVGFFLAPRQTARDLARRAAAGWARLKAAARRGRSEGLRQGARELLHGPGRGGADRPERPATGRAP